MTNMRMREACIRALADELSADRSVILMGEDIAEAGGAFKATEGLKAKFSGQRVRDIPIPEMGLLGAGLGFGCQHSQVLDGWFRGTSGLKVAVPSHGQNAYGLLRSAIQDNNPVIALESRSLDEDRGDVVTGDAGIDPSGKAVLEPTGNDV